MGLLKKLGSLFAGSPRSTENDRWVYARCNRCGEVVRGRIDLRNDLSLEYGESEAQNTYICRKLLSGTGKNLCFQKIEITLRFDARHRLLDQQIHGGEFVGEDAYQPDTPPA
jgi:hypothetical protein